MPKKTQDGDFYDCPERFEQLLLGIDRLSGPIYNCVPDDADRPAQSRFEHIVMLLGELEEAQAAIAKAQAYLDTIKPEGAQE